LPPPSGGGKINTRKALAKPIQKNFPGFSQTKSSILKFLETRPQQQLIKLFLKWNFGVMFLLLFK
jgi:hypothetical protein